MLACWQATLKCQTWITVYLLSIIVFNGHLKQANMLSSAFSKPQLALCLTELNLFTKSLAASQSTRSWTSNNLHGFKPPEINDKMFLFPVTGVNWSFNASQTKQISQQLYEAAQPDINADKEKKTEGLITGHFVVSEEKKNLLDKIRHSRRVKPTFALL